MQRQWTIEVRCDYADQGKNDPVQAAVIEKARELHAMMALLCDGVKPRVAVFSEDFFFGRKDFEVFDKAASSDTTGLDGVSDEMLALAKGIK